MQVAGDIIGQLSLLVHRFDSQWKSYLANDEESLSSLLISRRLLASDITVLKLCADKIDQHKITYHLPLKNDQHHPNDHNYQSIGRGLFDLIELACDQQYNQQVAVRIAAANAMSILNAAGVSFSGRDLSGLQVGPLSSSSSTTTSTTTSSTTTTTAAAAAAAAATVS